MVNECSLYLDGGFLQILRVYFRFDEDICNPHVRGADEFHLAPDAHTFVHGAGIPVHIAVVEALLRGLEHAYLKGVLGLRDLGDVVFADAEHADGGVRSGDLLAVHPDVRAVTESFEAQDMIEALFSLEGGGEYPRRIEDALVYGEIAVLFEDVLAEDSGFIQRPRDRARDDCVVGARVAFALHLPMGQVGGIEAAAARGQRQGREQNDGQVFFHNYRSDAPSTGMSPSGIALIVSLSRNLGYGYSSFKVR